MATSEVYYEGELRCKAIHLQSESAIFTDAPIDNHGKGEAFSPTDLLATSLGNCMLTIMGIEANRLNVSIDGAKARIGKHMAALPRRVAKIDVILEIPKGDLTQEQMTKLIWAGKNCPVAKSLHPDLVQNVNFNFY
jgi:putative redox protein